MIWTKNNAGNYRYTVHTHSPNELSKYSPYYHHFGITHPQADAAIARSKQFSQGGGGERIKAKARALEQAEKKNAEIGGPSLKWTV